ncbi:MAG: flagellin, partial [Cyanobacteria bacterium P01_E01_bin.34]
GPDVTAQQQVNIGVQSVAASVLGGTLDNGTLEFLSSLKSGGANSLANNKQSGNFEVASDILANSLDEVSSLRGRLGAFERNVLQTNVRSLQSSFENLSSSVSSIRDADFAAEPPSARGKYTARYFAKKQFSCSTFMLYLGLNRRYDCLPHHQLYLSEHILKRERPFIDDSALDEINPPFYVCNPTPVDPSNAPENHSTLYVLVPIPHTGHHVNWQAKAQSYRDMIIQRLPLLGYEDVAQYIVTETCYTANTWQDDYSIYLGAVFNLSHTWKQLGPFRPPIRSEFTERLYWVGGAVHPGSGLMTILEAAKNTARFVSQDLSG